MIGRDDYVGLVIQPLLLQAFDELALMDLEEMSETDKIEKVSRKIVEKILKMTGPASSKKVRKQVTENIYTLCSLLNTSLLERR